MTHQFKISISENIKPDDDVDWSTVAVLPLSDLSPTGRIAPWDRPDGTSRLAEALRAFEKAERQIVIDVAGAVALHGDVSWVSRGLISFGNQGGQLGDDLTDRILREDEGGAVGGLGVARKHTDEFRPVDDGIANVQFSRGDIEMGHDSSPVGGEVDASADNRPRASGNFPLDAPEIGG